LEETVLTVLEKCFRWQTGPIWTDNTLESQTPGGTPFTLAVYSDYVYFGHREKFNKLKFDLQAFEVGGSVTLFEYSKGAGAWGALTITDGTNGFRQDGDVTFTPPSDWAQATVNGVSNKFWVRFHLNCSTPATVNQIQINNVFNCLMMDPSFDDTAEVYNRTPYALLFLQQENPT
jgi:hypothetical protein